MGIIRRVWRTLARLEAFLEAWDCGPLGRMEKFLDEWEWQSEVGKAGGLLPMSHTTQVFGQYRNALSKAQAETAAILGLMDEIRARALRKARPDVDELFEERMRERHGEPGRAVAMAEPEDKLDRIEAALLRIEAAVEAMKPKPVSWMGDVESGINGREAHEAKIAEALGRIELFLEGKAARVAWINPEVYVAPSHNQSLPSAAGSSAPPVPESDVAPEARESSAPCPEG